MPRRSRRPKSSRPTVVDPAQPLSRSFLWRLQRNFFDRAGVEAWTAGIVPHYITSNPWIADAYAQVVLGWLRVRSNSIIPCTVMHGAYNSVFVVALVFTKFSSK